MPAMAWEDWIRTVEIEPSLYAADLARLGDQTEVLLRAGARIFHFDVGDGYFVPAITMGPIVLQAISPLVHDAGGALDVHMMTWSPERHFAAIAAAGGDSVTVHLEACQDNLEDVVRQAREHGLEVGLAFNPDTEPERAARAALAAGVDLVLCMSIYPGYSGQDFMPTAIPRIREVRSFLPPSVHVQVDGGIGFENIREVHQAGANLLVTGTGIFGREDLPRTYRRLLHELA